MHSLENPSILIVEDETIVAWDIQETLENFGYNVVARVASGAEAMQWAQNSKPSLALMDIKIEGDLSGIETADCLYHDFNIPVVFLSAYSDEQTLVQATQTEPFGYLLKPFHPKELHTTIQVALQRHQRESLAYAMQQWLANTLNSIGEPTIATDRACKVTYMNPLAEQFTGWTQDRAIGLSIDRVLPLISKETREAIAHPTKQVIASLKPVAIPKSYLLTKQNNSEVEVQTLATPLLDDAGEMMGSVIVFKKIEPSRAISLKVKKSNNSTHNLLQLRLINQLSANKNQYQRAIACTQILIQLLSRPYSVQSARNSIQWTLEKLGNALKLDFAWVALHDHKQNTVTISHEYRRENSNGDRLDNVARSSALTVQFSRSEFPGFYCPLSLGDSWICPSRDLLPPPYQALVHDSDRVLICPLLAPASSLQDSSPPLLGEIGILTPKTASWTTLEISLIAIIMRYAANLSQKGDLDSVMQAQQIDLDILNYLKDDFISSVSHELITPLSNMKMSMAMIHTGCETKICGISQFRSKCKS